VNGYIYFLLKEPFMKSSKKVIKYFLILFSFSSFLFSQENVFLYQKGKLLLNLEKDTEEKQKDKILKEFQKSLNTKIENVDISIIEVFPELDSAQKEEDFLQHFNSIISNSAQRQLFIDKFSQAKKDEKGKVKWKNERINVFFLYKKRSEDDDMELIRYMLSELYPLQNYKTTQDKISHFFNEKIVSNIAPILFVEVPVFKTSATLDQYDFKNINEFLKLIQEAATPITQFIKDQLSSMTKVQLKNYSPFKKSDDSKKAIPNPPSQDLVNAFLNDLNKVIEGPSIYAKDRFKDTKLSEGLKAKTEKTKGNSPQLNRELLENAFSGMILANWKKIPLIILVLALGGVFFTFRYLFINIKGFKHCLHIIQGKFDNPEDKGEITHFQALSSALSATIGLGNIAGVAIAIEKGGPGVIFWMWLTAFFGMSSKFSSCMLSQVYREFDEKTGRVRGGPMYYISMGLTDVHPGLKWLGKVLAVMFAVFCIGGALGGGNMFQANQTFKQISGNIEHLQIGIWPYVIGLVLAFFVGLVIIGGIKKIGTVTSKIVPFMCCFYVLVCIYIILTHIEPLPSVIVSIFTESFTIKAAVWGGFIGVLIQGVKRAAFSNEAGIGSAAIAHAAAKTDEPVREGIVAMIGPFIDTIIVCTMTAIIILVTKAHETGLEGVQMTSKAFESAGSWLPYALTIAVIFFAYSTVISWGYYGERSAEYLFGKGIIPAYRILYVLIVAMGPLVSLQGVIDFSDMMLLSMAFPNIIAMVILSWKGKELLDDYWGRYTSGEMKTYK